MGRLTDAQCKSLTVGKRISEPCDHGGSLQLWHRKGAKSSTRFWYFRIQKGGTSTSERLGSYPDIDLVTARGLARDISKIAKGVIDLKRHRRTEREKLEAVEQKSIDEVLAYAEKENRIANLGTLEQLCAVYITKMRSEGAKSATKVEKALATYVINPHPVLVKRRANSIKPEDISIIIEAMLDKNVTTATNRTRGDLHAAFNVGIKFDHSPALRFGQTLRFELEKNPVDRIAKTKAFERIRKRYLNALELSEVWNAAPNVMNPTYSSLLRIMICTGLHPVEFLRLNCGAVNLAEASLYVDETKAGNPIIVPLNRFALAEVSALIEGRGAEESLFPSRANAPVSDAYARASVLSNQVKRLRDTLPDLEHFTARDIRRTCKTLMGKAGVDKEMRDRLQNHTFGDTSSKVYDVHDYKLEKLAAANKWETWLEINVINPVPTGHNVAFIGGERS